MAESLPGEVVLARFKDWTARYIAATGPQRAALAEEGARLAQARRPIFKGLIQKDPKQALAQAVPMVVRQALPPEIVALLEERVNKRADLFVFQVTPKPDEPLPKDSLTYRIATFEDKRSYVANVYGDRALDLRGTRHDALNGVAVDNQFAVNDEPVRVMEAGEKPDPAKQVLTSCPVSGNEVVEPATAVAPIPEDVSVVETPEQVVYLCGGYHKEAFKSFLYAEGGTGGPVPISSILPAAPTPALGMLKVIFIPMTFADQNVTPTPEAKCYQIMRDVADYYAKASYGKLTTLTTVTPPVKLPHTEAWYVQKDTSNGGTIDGVSLERDHAREEAKRLGYDWQDYDCTVLRLSGGPRSAGGLGGVGNVWIWGDGVGVTAHEIGHSFTLSHANFWDTAGTSAIGAGTNAEYGDVYDVMGSGGVPIDHYNAQAKNQVKWLPDDFILDISQSGTYRVYAFDQPILDPANRYAMRITKDAQRVYWGEVRQLYNGSTSRPWADKGILLGWRFPNGGASNIQLIDTTPGSPFGKDDAAISIGQTFSDDESNIHITTVGVSTTTPKYVDLVVNMGAFPDNHPPTLALAASATVVPVNATVTFTATAADADGDTLAYSWQHFGDANVKIVSPNAPVITRTFTTAGTYIVTCTVSDMKGGTATRNQLITVGNGNGRFTISGRVTAGGAGVANVIVNANGLNAVSTDDDGYYTIPNLPANTYSMTPLLYGMTFGESFNNSVTVGPNFSGADFVADATPRVSITASVTNAQEPGTSTPPAVAGQFTITRVGDISQDMTVFVNPYGGTATLATDYTSTPAYVTASQGYSTFTIPAGQASLDIAITPISDAAAEGPETVILQLGPGNGYVVASPCEAVVTINDDPADSTLPKISLTTTTARVQEGSGTSGVVAFNRTGPTTAALTVNYTVSGTASAGTDYTSLTGTVVIPAGASSANVLVTPVNDTVPEAVETVILTVANSANYLIQSGAGTGTVSISDDDVPFVTVTAPDNTAAEVDLTQPGAKADTGTFLVSRTGDTSQSLTVYYALSGPSTGEMALHGVDYEALPGLVIIPAGETSATVTIVPRWDNLGEGTEWVTLNLGAGPTNYKLGEQNSASISIQDAAADLPTVEVIGYTTPAEPAVNGAFRFTVRAPTAAPLTVNYTLSGTANVTSDYTIAGLNTATLQGSVTITPSATAAVSQNLTVTIVDDAVPEDLKNLTLTITPSAAYQTFGPTSSATLWLKDDDQPTVYADAHVTNNPPSVVENGSSVAFYLSRTGSTASPLTVNYTMSGTATNGVDYDNGVSAGGLLSGTAVIPAGAFGVDVTVRPIDDAVFEGTETIVLTLAPGSYGRGPAATLLMTDNETSAQSVAFGSSGASGLESVATVNIPVNLATPATAPVSVEYIVDSGTRSSTTVTNATTYWVRVARVGDNFTFFQSPDGLTWTQRGNAVTISSFASSVFYAGLAVTSGQSGTEDVATFDNVSITDLAGGGALGSRTSVMVGTVNPTGSATFSGGVHTIMAGGGSITNGAGSDAGFRYVYFQVTNSTNCTLTARVISQTGSATGTRAGVMIREFTTANSRYAASLAQLNGTFLQGYRTVQAASSGLISFSASPAFYHPWWVKLQRAGNVFTASQSPDGVAWTPVGAPQTIALSSEVLAGLAVSARSDGLLSTATFDNMSLTGSPALAGRTVGYVNAQGTDSVAAGVYTLNGSGAGIGNQEDECHFLAAPVTGDFTLVARVLSQAGGAANAQAGVMVRENGTYRVRSLYLGQVENAATEFIYRNGSVSTAYGSGVDFALASGVLNFGIGDSTLNIPLQIINDSLPEPDEALVITLRNPNGALLGAPSQFTYTIVDDDSPPALPSVGFTLAANSAAENSGQALLELALSVPSDQAVTVDIAATGGTATAGTDYNLTQSSVTFTPGETVKTVPLTLVNDALVEGAKTVIVTLSNPVNATLGSQNQHTLAIIDDEFPVVTIVATDPNATEANLHAGAFTFYRTGPTTNPLTVNYTVSGTAGAADRQDMGASVTFSSGASTSRRLVVPLDDSVSESPETVILTISPDAAYTVGSPNTATVNVLDDDRSTITIVANDASASETPGNAGQFTVTRSAPTTAALTVALSISGTATNTADYANVPTSLVFAIGQSSRTIDILPVDDGLTEGPEVVTISIANGNYDIGASSFANVTIADNDSPPTVYISNPGAQGILIASNNGVMLNCTVTDDGAPQPVTLNWTQASGPGVATFESPTRSSTGVTFNSDGVYLLRVTASDGQFTVSDQITVVVGAAIAPANWITLDMQPTPAKRGLTESVGDVYTMTGSGVGYAGTADGGHVMMRQVGGDTSVVARLNSLAGGAASLAGVSIRDTFYRGACRAVLGYVAGTGLQFRTRTTVSTADTTVTQAGVTLPVWLKVERNGATGAITASFASDSAGAPGAWTQIGNAVTVPTDGTVVAGLTTCSGNNTLAATAVFDGLALTPAPAGPALITEDIGGAINPTPGTYAENNGTYTIGGSGGLDGGGYFAGRQYVGDLVVTAKLTDATSGAQSAKSGIMIRECMDSGGYVFLGRIPQPAYSAYLWRTIANGATGGVPSFTGKVRWMRLMRQGNRITGFHAPDVSGSPGAWIQIGQPQTVIMSSPVQVGFCVDNAGGVGLNVATFNNLTVVPLNKAPIVTTGTVTDPVVTSTALHGTVTDDGFPAPPNLSISWSALSGPPPVTFGNAALADTSANFGGTGEYRLRLNASDGSVATYSDLTVNAFANTFAVWQAARFTGGASNPAAAADADPDSDGGSNFFEFAFNTAPGTFNASPVTSDVEPIGQNKFLRLTVPKNPAAPDLIYTVQATNDVSNANSWTSAGLVIEVNNANTLRVRDNVPISTSGARRFMRCWVRLP